MSKLRISHVRPATLTPHPSNADVREITPAAKDALRRILDRFGFVTPLVVSEKSGYLLGGHQRRDIAIEDGIAEVPIVKIPDLSPEEEITIAVALNNAEAQGTFNLEGLTAVLGPIEDTPLLEATGFTFDQYQKIQLEVGTERIKAGREGATPPLADKGAKTRTKPGDRWHLGDHVLIVGDACFAKAYPETNADMTFTDPPYNVDIEGGTEDHLTMLNDNWEDAAAYAGWLKLALAEIANATDGAVYLCYAITQAPAVMAAWEGARAPRSPGSRTASFSAAATTTGNGRGSSTAGPRAGPTIGSAAEPRATPGNTAPHAEETEAARGPPTSGATRGRQPRGSTPP